MPQRVRRGRAHARTRREQLDGSREQAAALHGFYHDCYVMGDGVEPGLTQARLALAPRAAAPRVHALERGAEVFVHVRRAHQPGVVGGACGGAD